MRTKLTDSNPASDLEFNIVFGSSLKRAEEFNKQFDHNYVAEFNDSFDILCPKDEKLAALPFPGADFGYNL